MDVKKREESKGMWVIEVQKGKEVEINEERKRKLVGRE